MLRDAIEKYLRDSDATDESRNRFRLRRLSEHVEFELRVANLRAFYRVDGDLVRVVMIGEKRGERLIVDGEEFIL